MTTRAVKEKKVAAAEKRLATLGEQLRAANEKVSGLSEELLKAEKHLKWVSEMPVEDEGSNVQRLLDTPGTVLEGSPSQGYSA